MALCLRFQRELFEIRSDYEQNKVAQRPLENLSSARFAACRFAQNLFARGMTRLASGPMKFCH